MEGAVLVLIPDESYHTLTADPHCTLAFFGSAADLDSWQVEILKGVASDIAEMVGSESSLNLYYATAPKVTGRGIFQLDPEYSDGQSYAYVDLIDWNIFPRIRQEVESRAGFSINRGHGFIPHITLSFSQRYIESQAKPTGRYGFKWKSVELWIGDDHIIYPVS